MGFSAALLALSLAGWGLYRTGRETERPASTRVFGLYAVWLEGAGDEDRQAIDRFLECLLVGSTLNHFWQGEARVEVRGSWALPAPPERLSPDDVEGWLSEHVAAGRLPVAPDDETPVFLVFGGDPHVRVGSCGRNGQGSVAGREAGIGLVNNGRECWPTGDLLRTETQIATHEIVETVDRLLGYESCAGGGTCQGRGLCDDRCSTFVGLACPGAPTGTFTGCDGGKVDGWVVQKFAYAGRQPGQCNECRTCDFTPRVCSASAPRCGLEGGRAP